MNKNERFNLVRKIKLNLSDVKPNKFEPLEKDENDPCYEDYIQIGTKIVDGREVPNCIPLEASKVVKEGFPVPSPEGGEDEQTFVSRCISELYDEYGQEQASGICYSKWRES